MRVGTGAARVVAEAAAAIHVVIWLGVAGLVLGVIVSGGRDGR